MEKVRISPVKQQVTTLITVAAAIALFFVSVHFLQLDIGEFMSKFAGASSIIGNFFAFDITELPAILSELFVSVAMALGSLAVGIIISFVLAFLGADNTAPYTALSVGIKALISVIRAVPALVWILMIVASLGFGNVVGLVGMVYPTTGYLTKSFISSIEEQDPAIIETLKLTGATKLQIITEGLLPNLIHPFLSWISIGLERNIAESISFGMVGAGGIGTLIMRAIGKYDYPLISTVIVTIFVAMITVELLVTRMKRNLR